MRNQTLRASALLIGTIIGAGIFALPYAIAKVGFIAGLSYILFLGVVVLILNLMYGQIVLSTNGKHQLSGYAQKYLGNNGKIVAVISVLLGLYGGLLAYIVKVGQFLHELTGVGSNLLWSLLFFSLMSLLVFIGLKIISRFVFLLSIILLIVILSVIILGIPHVQIGNLSTFDPAFLFLPYGVILFALGGSSIIPEMGGIFDREKRAKLKKAIILGTVIPIALYALFSLMVVGVTGALTSDDAVTGLQSALPLISRLGAVFGIISMSSCFLSLGTILKDTYQYDFGMKKIFAWILACFVPLTLFLLGLKEFVTVISVAGALMSGFEGVVIILTYYKSLKLRDKEPEYQIHFPKWGALILMSVFFLGILYQAVHYLSLL